LQHFETFGVLSGVAEDSFSLAHDAVSMGNRIPTFRENVVVSSSGSKYSTIILLSNIPRESDVSTSVSISVLRWTGGRYAPLKSTE
jgi:hypothetical protein